MVFSKSVALVSVTAAVLVSGCAGMGLLGRTRPESPPLTYAGEERPRFLVTYYPYSSTQGRLAAPIPDYRGWTEERMERDVKRMQHCGLDGAILVLDYEVLADPFRSGRVRRFTEIAAAASRGAFAVVVMVEADPSGAPREMDRISISKWIVSNGLNENRCVWLGGGRPVFLAGRGVEVTGPPHPAMSVLAALPGGGDWRWVPPGDRSRLEPFGSFRQVLVYAGWRGDRASVDARGRPNWTMPRDRGEALRRELWQAFEQRASLICVSSWNDFLAGDFVEPNDLDGDTVLTVLASEIARVRQAGKL